MGSTFIRSNCFVKCLCRNKNMKGQYNNKYGQKDRRELGNYNTVEGIRINISTWNWKCKRGSNCNSKVPWAREPPRDIGYICKHGYRGSMHIMMNMKMRRKAMMEAVLESMSCWRKKLSQQRPIRLLFLTNSVLGTIIPFVPHHYVHPKIYKRLPKVFNLFVPWNLKRFSLKFLMLLKCIIGRFGTWSLSRHSCKFFFQFLLFRCKRGCPSLLLC